MAPVDSNMTSISHACPALDTLAALTSEELKDPGALARRVYEIKSIMISSRCDNWEYAWATIYVGPAIPWVMFWTIFAIFIFYLNYSSLTWEVFQVPSLPYGLLSRGKPTPPSHPLSPGPVSPAKETEEKANDAAFRLRKQDTETVRDWAKEGKLGEEDAGKYFLSPEVILYMAGATEKDFKGWNLMAPTRGTSRDWESLVSDPCIRRNQCPLQA